MTSRADIADRRRAAALILRMQREEPGRELLERAGHVPGKSIMVVLYSDTVGEVFGRLIDERPPSPALIAVYRADGLLTFISVLPEDESGLDSQDAGHSSTIGMLCDAMRSNGMKSVNLHVMSPARVSANLRAHEMAEA